MEETYETEIIELIHKLNNATESQILNAFKNSKNKIITKKLFIYYCNNNFDFSIKIFEILTKEIKEELKDDFFNFVLEKNINYSTVEALFLLGENYQKSYFEKNCILKNNLPNYDDYTYKVLIDREKHELYLDYVKACYKYNKKIPRNIERFKYADIKTNRKAQLIIEELVKKMYEDESYDNLLKFAEGTKVINDLPGMLNINKNSLYDKIKEKDFSYSTKRQAFMIGQLDKTKALELWSEEINKKIIANNQVTIHELVELIIIKYQLIEIENVSIKRSLIPKSSLIRQMQLNENDKLSEDEIFNLFYNHIKVFNTLYRKPKDYLEFIISEHLNNPFRSENAEIKKDYKIREIYVKGRKLAKPDHDYINFKTNNQVKKYIEKENAILENEAITFIKECNKNGLIYDEIFRLYFNSILKYIIPLDLFIENLKLSKDRKDIFRIYDTQIEGQIKYENNIYYLDTQYGNIKISFTNNIDLKRLCPGLKITAILSSYGYHDRAFRITKINPILNKSNYKEILSSCNKNEIKKEYHQAFKSEDFLVYASIEKFMDYLYLYAKYKEEFKNLDDKIISNMFHHLSLENEHKILKIFIKYLLGFNQDDLITELLEYIKITLEKRKTIQLTDLTNDYEFYKFRSKFNTLLYYLQDIDINFQEKIIESINLNNLASCTYMDLKELDKEYFEEIKNKQYIIDFYNKYPKYYKQDEDLNVFKQNKTLSKDLEFYFSLKCLVYNQNLYDDLKQSLINNFSNTTPYLEWITDLKINIYKFPKNSLIQAMYSHNNDLELTEEEKDFINKFKQMNQKSVNIKGNSLLELLTNIHQHISKEIIQKIKDLSLVELSEEEKKELSPVIIKLLTRSSIASNDLYELLESLSTNNPYNMNNMFSYEEVQKVSKDEIIIIDSITSTLNTALKKYNFFCMTPLHYVKEFNKYFKNVTDEQLKIVFSNYAFYGTIDIHEGGEKVRPYLYNIKIKESDVICEIDHFNLLPFHIIPHFDKIKFLYNKSGDYAKSKMHIVPYIDYEKEEQLLLKSKEDRRFFEDLSLADKKKTILHYCRYNIIEAFKFDKENIIDNETYLEINSLLDLYDETCGEALYIYLILNKYDDFFEAFDQNVRIEEKQQSLLDLQKYLVRYNDWELYDRLIEYLNKAHILNKVFIYEDAKEELEKREVYNKLYKSFDPDDRIEQLLLTDDLNEYMTIQKLNISNLMYSYKEQAYQKYIDKYLKYTSITNKKEVLFTSYIIFMKIIINKDIDEESINNLKEINSFELLKSDTELRKILFKEIGKYNKDIQNIFINYKNKIISDIAKNNLDLAFTERFILFSSTFTVLRKDLEEIILNQPELLEFSNLLKNDSYYIDYNLKGTLYSKIEKLEKNNKINIFSPDLLFFFEDLKVLEENFVNLNLITESKVLRNVLMKKRIFLKELCFSNKYKKIIRFEKFYNEENEKGKLTSIIKNAFNIYDINSILSSKWFIDLKNLQLELENLEEYLKRNEFTTIYDKNILNFLKLIYDFEKDLLLEEKVKDAKINIFVEFLKENNIYSSNIILVENLNKFIDLTKNDEYTKNNLSKKLSKAYSSNFGLDSSLAQYKIYTKDNILNEIRNIQKDLFSKEKVLDAYFLTLQYLIDYPNEELTNIMIKSLSFENLIIPDSKQSQNQELYLKASIELLKNKNTKAFYLLTKNTEKINPYYSTTITHNIGYINTDFIIADKELNKEEKIYLYMRSILKYISNFNSFLKSLFEEELRNNKSLVLNLNYPILLFVYNENSIKQPFKMCLDKEKLKNYIGCNVSIKITKAVLLNEELSLDFNVLEFSKQSSQKLINENDVLNKIIDKSNIKPYQKIIYSITIGRNEFGETIRNIAKEHEEESINKYILFNEKIFNNLYAIYYTSKVLYQNQKHLLLKQFLYLLISNKILNDRFLYQGFKQNEYVYTNKLNSKIAPSQADVFVFEHINIDNDLKDELIKILDEIDDEYKTYIYYVICYKYGYFEYKLDLKYTDEIANLIYVITYSLLKDNRDVDTFFESLKGNNIYNVIENQEKLKEEILSKAKEKISRD